MLNAVASHGTLLQKENTLGGGVWTTIAGVGDWKPPMLKREVFPTTTHEDATNTRVPSNLIENDEFKFKCMFNAAEGTHDKTTGLIKAFKDKTRDSYRALFPDGSDLQFQAYVTGIEFDAPNKGIQSADVTMAPTGDFGGSLYL